MKVLHGADGDVEWLQRDYSLFVVNMFDTGQAARVLQLPSYGLAYLLESMVGFQVRQGTAGRVGGHGTWFDGFDAAAIHTHNHYSRML